MGTSNPHHLTDSSAACTSSLGHKDEVPWLHGNPSARSPDPENGVTEETLLEWRRMVSGQVFNPMDPYLATQRGRVAKALARFNKADTKEEFEESNEALKELVGASKEKMVQFMPPFYMMWGHLNLEGIVYIGHDAHILDNCPVHIGTRTMIAERATIITGGHSVCSELRWWEDESGQKCTADGAPIYIGRDCWIGANVTITPGVRIGDGSVIGAGSVVNKDIPNRCVAAGNPVRIIRWLEEGESMEEYVMRFENGDNGGKMGRMAPGVPPPASRQRDAKRWGNGGGRVWENDYGRT